ncbi:MAG: M6 family metalloprotease domain-containing protein [Bacteroidales bacterium]|jgi:M6 family metalloprotease-like protein|nr:M6 family metalloprotease domain-containing protein [Bacteroidales bacterium]
MKKIISNLILVALLLITQISFAVPAYKGLITLEQPNGEQISVYLFGDERLSWIESEDNYTLLYNEQGYLEYAILDSDRNLVPSGVVAKDINKRSISDQNYLSSINKKLRYSAYQKKVMLDLTKDMDNSKASAQDGVTVGIRKLLVILVEYSDLSFTFSREQFENLFNQLNYTYNGATGSVRDYFNDNSYGKLDLQCTVLGPYTLANTQAFYGAPSGQINDVNAKQMIIDACNAADNDIDFSTFDNDGNLTIDGVHVVYAGLGQHNGGGANAIWAHKGTLSPALVLDGVRIINYSCACEKSSSNQMSGVGVHIHEFGHVLGLPDYYDTDYEENGVSHTFGKLDVMDDGSYNNNEKTPPLYNSYSKILLGWATPYIIDSNMLMDITAIPTTDSALVFQINTPTENEYFLFENMKFTKWNAYTHSSIINANNWGNQNFNGIVGIHVDRTNNATGWNSNCVNCNPSHNAVLLMSADGNYLGSSNGSQWSYSSMTNMLYPGTSSITQLNDNNDNNQSNLLSWNSSPSNVSLSEITWQDNSNVTFKTNGGASLGVGVSLEEPTQITKTSASFSASVTPSQEGEGTILEKGFVYNKDGYPRRGADSIIVSSVETNDFTFSPNNLEEGTTYYVRAYGVNSNGVSYSQQFSFLTLSDPITENYILDSNFAACQTGEMPTIIGSTPQGGSGEYKYRWLESTDNINWTITQNAGVKKDYTPSTLSDATYFKRVALSADKADTSAAKLVPIVPITVAGEVTLENQSIEKGHSTGEISLINNVGDVVSWQRKFETEQWVNLDKGNVTSFSEILNEAGSYQYRVRVRNGACPQKNTAAVSLSVTNIGLQDMNNDKINLNVYPNPTTGKIFIDLNLDNGKTFQVQLMDILGKNILYKTFAQGKTQLDLSFLENGNYILLIKDEGKVVGKQRIVIVK